MKPLAGGGRGRRDLVRRLAPVDPGDAVLHVRREVAHQHRGDVGDHAPAVLRGRAGQLQVLGHVHPGTAAGPGQRRGDDHARLAAAPHVRAAGMHDHPVSGLVALGDVGRAGELELDRPHPHSDPALVLFAAQILGQLGARQARGDLRDVLEELPDLFDRLSDLEVVLDQHRVSFFR